VEALRVHVHRQRNDIDIARAFTVSEERAFHPVGPSH
jgi:hypothetical protein